MANIQSVLAFLGRVLVISIAVAFVATAFAVGLAILIDTVVDPDRVYVRIFNRSNCVVSAAQVNFGEYQLTVDKPMVFSRADGEIAQKGPEIYVPVFDGDEVSYSLLVDYLNCDSDKSAPLVAGKGAVVYAWIENGEVSQEIRSH